MLLVDGMSLLVRADRAARKMQPLNWDGEDTRTLVAFTGSLVRNLRTDPWTHVVVAWEGMPDLNWRDPAVRAEMDAIASRWLARGVDGFRLDAVRYLAEDGAGLQQDRPDTHAYLGSWRANVLRSKERGVGKGGTIGCRSRCSPYH